MNIRALCFGLSFLLIGTSDTFGQGFKLPSLNPFAAGKKSAPPARNMIRRTGQPRVRSASRTITDSPAAKKARRKSWIPDLRPQWMKPKQTSARRAKYAKKQPSTLTTIGTSTTRFIGSLNPFRRRSKAARPRTLRPPTGSRMASPRTTPKKKSSSFLPSIFGTAKKPVRTNPRTPIEFLRQPRVQP